jgi:hypothetical protein
LKYVYVNTAQCNLQELKEKLKNAPFFQTLTKEDFGVTLELICLNSNIRKKVCGALDSFFSFLKTFGVKQTHNLC